MKKTFTPLLMQIVEFNDGDCIRTSPTYTGAFYDDEAGTVTNFDWKSWLS